MLKKIVFSYSLDFFRNRYFADNQGATSTRAPHMLLIREQRNTVATKIISKRRSFRRSLLFLLLFISVSVHAKEYQVNMNNGPVHVTTIKSSWCWNLAVSTKVGKMTDAGRCNYMKETPAQGVDSCDDLQLNGVLLERNAGSGFNCAATHVHSNETNRDGLDEYTLITDNNGHYINTAPNQGHINLN